MKKSTLAQEAKTNTIKRLCDTAPVIAPKTADMKCVKTLKGHSDWVTCLVEIRDGRIISGGEDGRIKLWSTDEVKCLSDHKAHSDAILALIQFTDTKLISCSRDKDIKVWSIGSMKETACININQPFCCISIVSDTFFAVGGGDNGIRIFDLANENDIPDCEIIEGHTNQVRKILMIDNLKNIYATGSNDCTVKVWDFKKKEMKCNLEGHTGPVNSLILLRNGNIASGSDDYTIKIWNWKTAKLELTFNEINGHPMSLVQLSENQLASGSSDWSIIIWNMTTTAEEFRLEQHEEGVGVILLTKLGQLVSGSNDNTIRVWQ